MSNRILILRKDEVYPISADSARLRYVDSFSTCGHGNFSLILKKLENIYFSASTPDPCSWNALWNGCTLESRGKTRSPCEGWEVHFPHPVPNTNQQICVCLLVAAVPSRGVTLGTMTPHNVAGLATARADTGSKCQTEWRFVSELPDSLRPTIGNRYLPAACTWCRLLTKDRHGREWNTCFDQFKSVKLNIEPYLRRPLRRCGWDKGCLGTVRLPNRNTEEGQSRDLQVTLARKPQHFHCTTDR